MWIEQDLCVSATLNAMQYLGEEISTLNIRMGKCRNIVYHVPFLMNSEDFCMHVARQNSVQCVFAQIDLI